MNFEIHVNIINFYTWQVNYTSIFYIEYLYGKSESRQNSTNYYLCVWFDYIELQNKYKKEVI